MTPPHLPAAALGTDNEARREYLGTEARVLRHFRLLHERSLHARSLLHQRLAQQLQSPEELEGCPLGERYQPEDSDSVSEDDECAAAQYHGPPDYRPCEPCSWLAPGMRFHGSQHHPAGRHAAASDTWVVDLTILDVDLQQGGVKGCMQASLPGQQPVTTFFEAEIIDSCNHAFWSTCQCCIAGLQWSSDSDLAHWSRFSSFTPAMRQEVISCNGRVSGLHHHSHIFMRIKEKEYVSVSSESTLTICGFYYAALDRATGHIRGYYHDTYTHPQLLTLDPACATGVSFGSWGFAPA